MNVKDKLLDLPWTAFKTLVDDRAIPFSYYDDGSYYWVQAKDPYFDFACSLPKDSSSDTVDFETNYKTIPVTKYNDEDGDTLYRLKIAPRGWSYQAFCFEIKVGKHNSLRCQDKSGNNISGFTYKIYDSNNAEITDPANESNAVKTVLTYESPTDFCIVAGRFDQVTSPTNDLYMWTIAVPDIAEVYGGSKYFVQGGLNLKYLDNIITEGRAPKRLNYDSNYHTNKLEFTFKHNTSTNHEILFVLDLYRP